MSGVKVWLENVFDEGQAAFDVGLRVEACPYRPHTREAQEWRAGWWHRCEESRKEQRAA